MLAWMDGWTPDNLGAHKVPRAFGQMPVASSQLHVASPRRLFDGGPFFWASARLSRWTDGSRSPVASSQLPAAFSGLRRRYTPVFLDGRQFFADGSQLPVARRVFSVPFFLGGHLWRNSGALPLPVASSSLRFPGLVFRRFLLHLLVFRFSLLPSVSPIFCFLVLPGSGVFLSRCLVAFPGFCGFCEWPMHPDCCVPSVAYSGLVYPVFEPCCFVVLLPPPAFCRYGVFRFRCFVSLPRFLL